VEIPDNEIPLTEGGGGGKGDKRVTPEKGKRRGKRKGGRRRDLPIHKSPSGKEKRKSEDFLVGGAERKKGRPAPFSAIV